MVQGKAGGTQTETGGWGYGGSDLAGNLFFVPSDTTMQLINCIRQSQVDEEQVMALFPGPKKLFCLGHAFGYVGNKKAP
jgi:hypothetical protein